MTNRPNDFSVTYVWCEGTVPPPHYSEYRIQLGPETRGTIKFWPDYPQFDSPVWEHEFSLDERDLEKLFARLEAADALKTDWPDPDEERPVGGSLEWLDIQAGERQFKIPSHIEITPALEAIFRLAQSYVPDRIWDDLRRQKAVFEENYSDN